MDFYVYRTPGLKKYTAKWSRTRAFVNTQDRLMRLREASKRSITTRPRLFGIVTIFWVAVDSDQRSTFSPNDHFLLFKTTVDGKMVEFSSGPPAPSRQGINDLPPPYQLTSSFHLTEMITLTCLVSLLGLKWDSSTYPTPRALQRQD